MKLKLFIIAVFVHTISFVGFVQSFDYKDEIAQGTCTSLITESDHIYAVRRTCTSNTPTTCDAVCSNIGKKCFNALHVYSGKILGGTESGKQGLHTYKYNSCTGTNCGPNFCCCSDKPHAVSNPNAFKDYIAQSACTAILHGSNHVYAVRRQCSSSSTDDCNAVCKALTKTCYNSLHVYGGVQLPASDTGKVGLHTFRYNSCASSGCGPNFCCCSG
ncbi:uncharacterized protein LOC123532117 [Mercenaria mercenaria]|uniref:uncharacterized protein LOC123532117 n=1 Tax=Mercenaria mercenaria TaxID=6596 RepID=UPI001E1D37D1|nr:uncharacterized protein LOC123532117 [Mercenaria mercenaria]